MTETLRDGSEMIREASTIEPTNGVGLSVNPADGLRGFDLVRFVHNAGETILPDLNEIQKGYLAARSRRYGKVWPKGFFKADIDDLIG